MRPMPQGGWYIHGQVISLIPSAEGLGRGLSTPPPHSPSPPIKRPETVDKEELLCALSHTWVLKNEGSQTELLFPPTWGEGNT